MLIKDVFFLLKEYNSSNTNTTLVYQGGSKATGKNFDNIITGKAKPYKGNEYETKYGKLFPSLAALVKKLKSQVIKGDIIVNGPALEELKKLLQTYQPRPTPEGDYSLPFGDNVRMKYRSNAIFIGFHEPNKSSANNISNFTQDSAITK